MESRAIRAERTFSSTPAAVWRTLTEPELLEQWWAPGDIAAVEGHRFSLDIGPWGTQACQVLEVVQGSSLKFLFSEGGLNTTITWTLQGAEGGTLFTLEHAGFDLDDPMGRAAFEGMGAGWGDVIARIEPVAAGLS